MEEVVNLLQQLICRTLPTRDIIHRGIRWNEILGIDIIMCIGHGEIITDVFHTISIPTPIASYVHHIHLFLTFVTIFLCDAGDSTVTRWTTASGCISSLIFICLLIPKVFAAVRTIAPQRWSNSLIDQLYPNCLLMLLPLVYCRYTH